MRGWPETMVYCKSCDVLHDYEDVHEPEPPFWHTIVALLVLAAFFGAVAVLQ